MNVLQKSALAAAVAAASLAVTAAEQTGTLTVTTTITASCEAPSPAGNLSLPFDNEAALSGDNQPAASSVAVTVTCSGNPTVEKVVFNGGSYSTGRGPAPGHRLMLRSGENGTQDTQFLGYKLYASDNTSTDVATENSLMAIDGNQLLGADWAGTFWVSGRIFEESGGPISSASDVVGGSYRDTVTMTIHY